MADKHLSTQFDSELSTLSSQMMTMGGLVESQIQRMIQVFGHYEADLVEQILDTEIRINDMEMSIDRELASTIGRRQPAARDLRLLLAISKNTANLERAGDEVAKLARMTRSLMDNSALWQHWASDLRTTSELALNLMRKSLDAFARMDTTAALVIIREDHLIDHEFNGFLRQLITYMMEDPRTISASLEMVFMAKAIERVGDHAKNIAEATIYVVKGADVRHRSMEQIESTIG